MNTTTTANVIEMVIATGVKSAAEIESFVTGLGRNVTIAMLDEALDQLVVAHTTKQTKAVKINLFARALESDIDELVEEAVVEKSPAAEDHPVAEVNQKEEVEMTPEEIVAKELHDAQMRQNQKAMEKSAILKKGSFGLVSKSHNAGLSKEVQALIDKAVVGKDTFFKGIGDFGVRVENIWFYGEEGEVSRQEKLDRKYVRTSKGVNKNGTPWEQTILGEVTVRIPKDYMQIKFYNKRAVNPNTGRMGVQEWLDFNGYNEAGARVRYDADFTKPYNTSRMPAEGSALLVLNIKLGKDGRPFVSLPADPDKTGTNGGRPWPIFKTADVRYINSKNAKRKDESMYVADNNHWFNAQVTAYIQAFTGEFVQEDVRNIHAINKLCATCHHATRLFQRDGVNYDLDSSKKTRAVIETVSTDELLGGSLTPELVCGLDREFKDVEVTLEINERMAYEKDMYLNEEGDVRFVGHNQIMVAGKAVNRFEYRADGTKEPAEDCVHYHTNAPKTAGKIAAEKAALREAGKNDYTSPFYKEWARVERQQIQVLVEVEGKRIWVPKFPGEVTKPLAMRVKSAGLTVYGSKNVFKYAEKKFVAETKEFDARHADVMNKINQIFYAARYMWKLDEEQAEAIFEIADNKPEDITDEENRRWDAAVVALANAIIRAEEREAAKQYAAFAPFFFTTKDVVLAVENEDGTITEEPAELVEINVDEVIGDFKETRKTKVSMDDLVDVGDVDVYDKDGNLIDHIEGREANKFGKKGNGTYQALRSDYLNDAYDDLEAFEFTRRLDDIALDLVWSVIKDGTRYVVVGDDVKEVELVAGALQDMLQKELTENFYVFADGTRRNVSLVHNIKNDEDPEEALERLEACDEVKDYVAELLGL
jgi:hypothetical protein